MIRNKERSPLRLYAFNTLLCLGISWAVLPMSYAAAEDGPNDAFQNTVAVKRDPFWPVGYSPNNAVQGQQSDQPVNIANPIVNTWDNAMKQVSINGVSQRSEDEFFAIINGEVKTVGDQVSVRLGNSVYTWVVESIQPPERVKLRRLSVM